MVAKPLSTGALIPPAALRQIGDMPRDRTRRNMELFSREVMPALREQFGNGN
jgi:hypothetical protein